MFWRLAAWDRPVLSCSEDHCDFSTVCLPTHCFASHYVIFIVRACTLQFGGICHRTWSSILVNIIIFLSLYVTTHDPHFLSILLLLLFVIICQRTRSSIFVIIIIIIICQRTWSSLGDRGGGNFFSLHIIPAAAFFLQFFDIFQRT